jgi:hypothetical protein
MYDDGYGDQEDKNPRMNRREAFEEMQRQVLNMAGVSSVLTLGLALKAQPDKAHELTEERKPVGEMLRRTVIINKEMAGKLTDICIDPENIIYKYRDGTVSTDHITPSGADANVAGLSVTIGASETCGHINLNVYNLSKDKVLEVNIAEAHDKKTGQFVSRSGVNTYTIASKSSTYPVQLRVLDPQNQKHIVLKDESNPINGNESLLNEKNWKRSQMIFENNKSRPSVSAKSGNIEITLQSDGKAKENTLLSIRNEESQASVMQKVSSRIYDTKSVDGRLEEKPGGTRRVERKALSQQLLAQKPEGKDYGR